MVKSKRTGSETRLAPVYRRWLLVGLTALSAAIASWYVLPYESGGGVFTLNRPATAAVRFGLLVEFLRCSYLGLDGRSPSRLSSRAPGETFSAVAERGALIAVGSFTAVVFVSWLARIPLDLAGLIGTTGAVAAVVGAFQLFGSSLQFLRMRYRRVGQTLLASVLLMAVAFIVWRLSTAAPGQRLSAALEFALFSRVWGFLPPVHWIEKTVSTYAEFGRSVPPTFTPYAALGAATLLYVVARWMGDLRRGTSGS